MEHIGSHIKRQAARQEKVTERGEMLKYFMQKLNAARLRDGLGPLTMPRMGKTLQAIPTKDLYYLKSVCEQATDFSKKFWWEINPKNHTPEAKAKAAKRWEEKKRLEQKNKYK